MATKSKTTTSKTNTSQVRHTPPDFIDSKPFYGKMLDNAQLNFANAIWSKDVDIVFCNAKAGCGKTFVATGIANMLVGYGLYKEIVYIMAPYAEKSQGFLPGSIEEKSAVYFDAFLQALKTCRVNLNTAIKAGGITSESDGYITCITDTYLRGANLYDAVVILDEAQNMTLDQMKKILTRVSDNTKVIVIGHTEQCDLPNKSLSGFEKYLKHFAGQERCAICELTENHRGWISRVADELV